MRPIPNVAPAVLAKARSVWESTIDSEGREVTIHSMDGLHSKTIRAIARRPKIMGLFDRTEQSYDQERYVLMCKFSDFDADNTPDKFGRARWDDEDHVFISTTPVDLQGVVFGYRIMVKG